MDETSSQQIPDEITPDFIRRFQIYWYEIFKETIDRAFGEEASDVFSRVHYTFPPDDERMESAIAKNHKIRDRILQRCYRRFREQYPEEDVGFDLFEKAFHYHPVGIRLSDKLARRLPYEEPLEPLIRMPGVASTRNLLYNDEINSRIARMKS